MQIDPTVIQALEEIDATKLHKPEAEALINSLKSLFEATTKAMVAIGVEHELYVSVNTGGHHLSLLTEDDDDLGLYAGSWTSSSDYC